MNAANGLDYRAGITATKGPAYAVAGSAANAERILLLDGVINLITEAYDKVDTLTHRVADIADSIYGPLPPTPETGGKVASGYNGRAGGLDTVITNLHAQLKELEAQIERIRGL